MGLQRDMDPNVRSDVVAFNDGDMAVSPCALQIEIVRTFAANVSVANMFLVCQLVLKK